ncbi:Mitochondrial import protein Pam17, partial [Rhizoctonia solani]
MHPVLRVRSGNVLASNAFVRHTPIIPKVGLKNIRLSSTTASPNEASLSWPEYLTIRKKKRRWEVATTIPSTFLALTLGLSYFGSIESDPSSLIFGVEPIYIYGVATMGCGVTTPSPTPGPVVGNSLWRMTHRQILPRIEARDVQFYQHIVKNRVDPSRQTATCVFHLFGPQINSLNDCPLSNPVPDFYGG